MLLRHCLEHGHVTGPTCLPGCSWPLVSLQQGREWAWAPVAEHHSRQADMIALAESGLTDAEIARWLQALGLRVDSDEVGRVLGAMHAR